MTKQTDQLQEIERLFTEIREYRDGNNFRQLLEFCARFKYLSPYNAWLVQLQMPGARFTLTEAQWKNQYKRQLKRHARPLIILQPFGPINMVFDISDTAPSEDDQNLFDSPYTDDMILNELMAPHKTRGTISPEITGKLIRNIKYSGIAIKTFEKGTRMSGEICRNHDEMIELNVKDRMVKRRSDYVIYVNSRADHGEVFATILHELGHLFCHHIPDEDHAWKVRKISHAAKEFEAETVSWLICERLEVGNPSEKYLNGYLDEQGNIPEEISIHHILLAVNEIEKILSVCPSKALKDGLLWKYRKGFRESIR